MPESLSQLEDDQLAAQACAGCRQSFEELIDRYSARLVGFVCQRVASIEDAEDIAQETLVKAYTNLGKYDSRYKFSTWLFTIAYRTAVSHFRWHRCRQVLPIEERTVDRPDELVANEDESRNVWRLAKNLSPGKQEALWLRYHEDMEVADIAKVMGKGKVHVRVLLHRARNELAEMLQDSEDAGVTGRCATAPVRRLAGKRGTKSVL